MKRFQVSLLKNGTQISLRNPEEPCVSPIPFKALSPGLVYISFRSKPPTEDMQGGVILRPLYFQEEKLFMLISLMPFLGFKRVVLNWEQRVR